MTFWQYSTRSKLDKFGMGLAFFNTTNFALAMFNGPPVSAALMTICMSITWGSLLLSYQSHVESEELVHAARMGCPPDWYLLYQRALPRWWRTW